MHWTNGAGSSFDVTVTDVVIDGTHVAFSGVMSNGQGVFAANDGDVIQEYIETSTNNLYGFIGGPNVAPSSTVGLDGPFPYTGTVTAS